MKELALTADQQTSLRRLQTEHRKTMATIRAELEIKTIDYHTEIQKEKADPAVLAKLTDEIVAVEGRKIRARLEHQAKMMALFTPEQKAKLAARMSERMMNGPGGPGGGPGDGPGGGPSGGPGGPDGF